MLVAWRQVCEQIGVFDKAIRVLVKSHSACRLLMSVPFDLARDVFEGPAIFEDRALAHAASIER